MADSLLRVLQSLPPGLIYVGVFVLAALENVFPHPPADVGVALAAFLAGRGTLSVWSVLGLAWTGNVSSAACTSWRVAMVELFSGVGGDGRFCLMRRSRRLRPLIGSMGLMGSSSCACYPCGVGSYRHLPP